MRSKTILMVGGAAVVLAAAVGGVLWTSSSDEPASAVGLQRLVGVRPQVAEQRLEAIEAEAPPEQQEAIADGDVTLAEYEQAVDRSVSCLEQGFAELRARYGYGEADLVLEPTPREPSADGFQVEWSYLLEGPLLSEATPEQQDAFSELEARCQEEEMRSVEEAYQVEQLADPAYVEEVTTTFADCTEHEAGVEVDAADEDEVISTIVLGVQGPEGESVKSCLHESPAVSSGLGNAQLDS